MHRRGGGGVTCPWGRYLTTDGYASVVIIQSAHWQDLAAWIHKETDNEAVLDPAPLPAPTLGQHMDEVLAEP